MRQVTGGWTENATMWNARPALDGTVITSRTGFTSGAGPSLDLSPVI
ncbi:hypothetical protein ACU635_60425 [[Actinomadura] parvosata]